MTKSPVMVLENKLKNSLNPVSHTCHYKAVMDFQRIPWIQHKVIVCMCTYVHAGIAKGRGVHALWHWDCTISRPVIHIHQWHTGRGLDGLHPSPDITHYSCRLCLPKKQDLEHYASLTPSVCIWMVFFQFRRCLSTDCSCGHSRDCTSVPEGGTKVRPVTREKGH